MIFTNIPELDTEILYHLSNKDIYALSQVNQYISNLCYKNKQLKQRCNTNKTIYYDYPLLLSGIHPYTKRKIRINGPQYNKLLKQYTTTLYLLC